MEQELKINEGDGMTMLSQKADALKIENKKMEEIIERKREEMASIEAGIGQLEEKVDKTAADLEISAKDKDKIVEIAKKMAQDD